LLFRERHFRHKARFSLHSWHRGCFVSLSARKNFSAIGTQKSSTMSPLRIFTVASTLAAFGGSAQGALSITDLSFTYSQNFDSLANTGTGNAFANNSTLPGWSLLRQPAPGTAIASYNAGTGSSNAGAIYSFGATGSTDRALGGVASGGAVFGSPSAGSVAAWIAVAFINNTTNGLASITVGFDGEQWRDGGAATPTIQTMVMQWGIGDTFDAVTAWTNPGGNFDWSSPVAANTGTGAAVDGNSLGLVSGRGGTISGLALDVGDTLWIRWVENNDFGNDHGLAIDNFQVTALTAVPEPTTALLGALGVLGLLRRRR
jgi:hypothetical protein